MPAGKTRRIMRGLHGSAGEMFKGPRNVKLPAMKRGPGRPKLPASLKRSVRIPVRLTGGAAKQLEALARERGQTVAAMAAEILTARLRREGR